MKIPIKGTNYSRDLTNMALLCNDHKDARKFESEIAQARDSRTRADEINKLKAELSEMKMMLQTMMSKLDRG